MKNMSNEIYMVYNVQGLLQGQQKIGKKFILIKKNDLETHERYISLTVSIVISEFHEFSHIQ